MTVPPNEWKHLQSVLMQCQNRIVRDRFRDLDGNEIPEDITTPKGSLKTACMLKATDSHSMTVLRMWLFYDVLKYDSDSARFYGIPVETFHETVVFQPQISLIFYEKQSSAKAHNRQQVRREISIRIAKDVTELTRSEVERFKERVKTLFLNTHFKFDTGINKYSYRDRAKGYQMILTCPSEGEARRVIEQVLDIQNHSPDWDNLTESKPNKNFSIPETKMVLGKQTRIRRRPVTEVHFVRAELKIAGREDEILCQRYLPAV